MGELSSSPAATTKLIRKKKQKKKKQKNKTKGGQINIHGIDCLPNFIILLRTSTKHLLGT